MSETFDELLLSFPATYKLLSSQAAAAGEWGAVNSAVTAHNAGITAMAAQDVLS